MQPTEDLTDLLFRRMRPPIINSVAECAARRKRLRRISRNPFKLLQFPLTKFTHGSVGASRDNITVIRRNASVIRSGRLCISL
jgi:hypothetical protein